MSSSNLAARAVPYSEGQAPPAPAANPVGCLANHPLTNEIIDVFLDWRALRRDDDPASAAAGTRLPESLDRLFHNLARRPPGSALDAEEAEQEAWLVLLSNDPADRISCAPGEYQARMIKKIRNRLIDLERYHRQRLAEPLDDSEAATLVGREVDPALQYERSRVLSMVQVALTEARDRLSETSFRILILCGIDGHSYAEVAEILGMRVDRVRDRHRRILARLRALLICWFGSDSTSPLAAYQRADPCHPKAEEMTS